MFLSRFPSRLDRVRTSPTRHPPVRSACSSLQARAHWAPSLDKLDATALPLESTDRLRLLDLSTRQHSEVELVGLPTESHGVWVHGIDALVHPDDPSTLVLFLVSHRPRAERALSPELGADSVVEIFETRIGSNQARWVATGKHELVRTPNNPVATGPRSFYVTNDHRRKVHWVSRACFFDLFAGNSRKRRGADAV